MLVIDKLRLLDIAREIWKPLAILFVLDVIVTVLYIGLDWTWITPTHLPLPLLGTGLAVFLGVRNSTAYARWWEARTLWGTIVNQSRNLARTLATLMARSESDAARRCLVLDQIAWAHAVRCTLWRDDPLPDIARMLPADVVGRVANAANVPFAIQREMAEVLAAEVRGDRLDPVSSAAINSVLSALTDAQGGLERIRNTPIPRQYVAFPRIFVAIYCFLLPFGIVPDLNILTPVGSAVIGLLFLTLDISGRHLESPFARSVHEVPMTALTRTIEADLEQSLGAPEMPAPMRPALGGAR